MITETGVEDVLNKKRPTIKECKTQIRELLDTVNEQTGSIDYLTNRCKQLIDNNGVLENRINNVAIQNDKLRSRNHELAEKYKKIKIDNLYIIAGAIIIVIVSILYICLV